MVFSGNMMMSLLMAALLLWMGVSILLAIRRLNRSYDLSANRFIYPANCRPEDCRDVAGFVRFMTPRFLTFAVLCLLLGALLLLLGLTKIGEALPSWVSTWAPLFLFLPLFVWYVVFINKAAKRFW